MNSDSSLELEKFTIPDNFGAFLNILILTPPQKARMALRFNEDRIGY